MTASLGIFTGGRPPASLDEKTLIDAWTELKAMYEKKEKQRLEMKERWMPVLRWLQDTGRWHDMTTVTTTLAKLHEGADVESFQLAAIVDIEAQYWRDRSTMTMREGGR